MNSSPPPVSLHAHPPERGRRSVTALYCGASCCCCCCIHTLGGLAGVAVVAAVGRRASPPLALPAALDLSPPPRAATRSDGVRPDRSTFAAGSARQDRFDPYDDEDVFDLCQPSRISAVALFWYGTLVLSLVTLLFGLLYGASGLMISLIVLLMVLPGLQLIAGVVAGVVLLSSSRHDRNHQLGQLGKILLGLMAGVLVGCASMFGLALLIR